MLSGSVHGSGSRGVENGQADSPIPEPARDFTWEELFRLPESVGYEESRRGRTGGSRRRFLHAEAPAINLHRPHPGNIVRVYVINEVLRLLTEEELI